MKRRTTAVALPKLMAPDGQTGISLRLGGYQLVPVICGPASRRWMVTAWREHSHAPSVLV
jgi:hypothetical protein